MAFLSNSKRCRFRSVKLYKLLKIKKLKIVKRFTKVLQKLFTSLVHYSNRFAS